MRHFPFSVLILALITTSFACRTTENSKPNNLTESQVTAKSNNRPHEQEAKALQLLGKATSASPTVTVCDSGACTVCLDTPQSRTRKILGDLLLGKDIGDNFYQTAERIRVDEVAKDCSMFLVAVVTEKSPTFSEVKRILGEPDSTSAVNDPTPGKKAAGLFIYGWIGFQVENDRVTLLIINFGKSGKWERLNSG